MKEQEQNGQRLVIALVGPTASGKTGLGLLLAEALGTEIIGVDSRQIYRHLDIGTAKPTPDQRRLVPHHLIDIVEPDQPFSVGRYREEVNRILPLFEKDSKIPLFVGGTGLYLKTVLEGLCPAPPANPALREWLMKVATFSSGGLHALLQRIDPDAARRIHPNDSYRLIRALEVYYLTGEILSSRQTRHRFAERPFRAIIFGLNRSRGELDSRIRQRLQGMFQQGLLREVAWLLEKGYSPDLPSLRAVGYPQMIAHLRGDWSLEEALENTRKATWQYARRQMTWFRAVPGVTWLNPEPGRSDQSLAQEVLEKLRQEEITTVK